MAKKETDRIINDAGNGNPGDKPVPPKFRRIISDFYVTDAKGNDIKMNLLGYAEVNGSAFAICRPDDADPGKAVVFKLFYAGKELCFQLVSDRKLCEAAMDSYLSALLK